MRKWGTTQVSGLGSCAAPVQHHACISSAWYCHHHIVTRGGCCPSPSWADRHTGSHSHELTLILHILYVPTQVQRGQPSTCGQWVGQSRGQGLDTGPACITGWQQLWQGTEAWECGAGTGQRAGARCFTAADVVVHRLCLGSWCCAMKSLPIPDHCWEVVNISSAAAREVLLLFADGLQCLFQMHTPWKLPAHSTTTTAHLDVPYYSSFLHVIR